MKNEFKVGDRVENISATDDLLGMNGTITRLDTSSLPYYVKYDNGDNSWEYENDLKLIQPPMKNIKDLGEKVAIQCKTQEEWDFVTKELGYKWEIAKFDIMGEDNCICTSDKQHSSVLYYTQRGYTILQASDFMPLSPQDEIKELKARIATLEETLRPKKKIEFVWLVQTKKQKIESTVLAPSYFNNVTLLHKGINGELDLIKAWTDDESNAHIYLGHFNDGIK